MTFRPVPKQHASSLQALADERRLSSTSAERRLERILNSVNGGVLRGQFMREWVCGKDWIVDFFFPEIRLAIEVDGRYHRTPHQLFRDLEREIEIEKFEVTLIRFSNDEVFGARDPLLSKLRDGWRAALKAGRLRAKSKATGKTRVSVAAEPILQVTASEFCRSTRRPPIHNRGGWTSVEQGSRRIGDNFPKQHVDEGIGGSRDANREVRKQQYIDLRKRGRSG